MCPLREKGLLTEVEPGIFFDRRSRGTGGVTDAYVCPLLPLTCLAPDIVEAILDGRQPRGLRLAEMLGNGALAWEEQRDGWGFSESYANARTT